MPNDIPSPWKGFLEKLDTLLEEPVQLDCIGGFAVVMGYGLPRATNDLDYRTLNPFNRINDLQRIAGPGSPLAKEFGVYAQYTAVDSMPENYEDRLTELFPCHFKNLRLFIPDPYDLVLSKLTRNIDRDRQDVQYLATTQKLDSAILRERYKELIPNLIGPQARHSAPENTARLLTLHLPLRHATSRTWSQKGALMREGELRHARYRLNIALRPVGHVSINERGDVIEV